MCNGCSLCGSRTRRSVRVVPWWRFTGPYVRKTPPARAVWDVAVWRSTHTHARKTDAKHSRLAALLRAILTVGQRIRPNEVIRSFWTSASAHILKSFYLFHKMAFPEPQHYGGSAGPGGFAPPQQQQQQAPCGGHDQQYGGAYPQASPYQSSYPQAPQYGQHDASQYGQQQYAQSSPYGGTSSPAPGGEASGYYGQQGAPSHDQYGQPGQQQQQPVQYDEQGNPIGPNGERGIGTMALGE